MQGVTNMCKRGLPESKKFISHLSEFTSQIHNCAAMRKRLLLPQELTVILSGFAQRNQGFK